jgi:hypothetical protein
MVKSKKMSKTSIAVIVLAIMLVLSLVLGLTGAWFTKTSSDSLADRSFTFGNIATATVSYASAGADTIAVDNTHILPGDTIKGGTVTVQLQSNVAVYAVLFFDAESGSDAYYVISNGAMTTAALTSATNVSNFLIGTKTQVAETSITGTITVADIVIPQTTVVGDTVTGIGEVAMGGTFTIGTAEEGTYYLRVIQADNISNADAYTFLTTGTQASSVHAD